MTKNRDYIPSRDIELEGFARKIYDYALANAARWEVSSPEGLLKKPLEAYEKALNVFKDANHGKIDTFNKNEAKKELVRQLRLYIQGFIIRNPNVTGGDKTDMGLPLRDKRPTAHPVPSTQPYLDAVSKGRGDHLIKVLNSDTKTKSKPAFVKSIAFARRMRMPEEPVCRAEDMPSENQTSAEKIFMYKEYEYGFAVDYAAAYVNATGKQGPWSEVVSLVITK
jgi:hypothetical protein